MDKGLSSIRHLYCTAAYKTPYLHLEKRYFTVPLSLISISLFTMVWLIFFCQAVHAETIVLSDTIPTKTTNWSDELTIPAFQSAWGELTSITMTLETPIAGSVSYENTSAETVLITSTHAVSVNLQLLEII